MDADGGNVRRLTHEPGYDGGAFFSPDGKRIVYRASHPATAREEAEYRDLLRQNLVRPTTLEIWVMDADGSNKRQVTHLNAASFAPYFFPDGHRIIFSSNYGDPRGREFDLYMVRDDGTGLERITTSPEFDGFPMFSPDGRQLVFASNRHGEHRGDTNIFIADWVDSPPAASAGGGR
jgi:Tol biopolymer transport system component